MTALATPEGLLEAALARVPSYGRNNTGFWLACQLRDSGMDYDTARGIMDTYRASVPKAGGSDGAPYDGKSALASLRQAYRREAREPIGTRSRKRGAFMPKPAWNGGGKAIDDPEAAARLEAAKPGLIDIADTPAAEYLARRGISLQAAQAAGAMFHPKLAGHPTVCFPLRDQSGSLVALGARAIEGPADTAKRTVGPRSGACFYTPGALDADPVAITEAPIDALTLSQAGLPAFGLFGVDWPAWLPPALRWRTVYVATDADPAGDHAAELLIQALQARGAKATRLRPPEGAKDWNEALQRDGKITLPPKACGMPPAVPSPASLPPVTTGKTSQRENAVQRPLEAINAEWLELLEWWRFYQQPTDGKALIVDGVELSPYDLTCRLEFVAELIDHHPAEGWTVKMLTDLREATLRP